MKHLLTLAFISSVLSVSSAFAQYATDFEAPTFTAGSTINGQDSWTTSPTANGRVLTATQIAGELTTLGVTPGVTVHSGSQALLVSGTGSSGGTVRVVTGLGSETEVLLNVWVRPLTSTMNNPTGNVFVVMENSAGKRAAGFRFGPLQSIDYGLVSGNWVPTGKRWDPNTWYRMTMRVNYTSQTYDFSIDGVQVNTSPIPFYEAASDSFSQIRVYRGSNQAGVIVDDLSVSVAGPRREIFWSETGGFGGPNLGSVYSAAFDGSDKVAIVTGLNRPIGLALDIKNGHIYWAEDGFGTTDNSRIVRANFDGSNPTPLFIGRKVGGAADEFSNAQILALDLVNKHVYWTDYFKGVVRGNLDGTGYTLLGGSNETAQAVQYTALALDTKNGHIYYGDPTQNGRLFRMNMDGGNKIEIARDLATDSWWFNDISLDVRHGHIYYTDAGTHQIKRMNMDGSDQTVLLTDPGLNPFGVALGPNQKMFWIGGTGMRLGSANIDGVSDVNLNLASADTTTGFDIAAVYVPVVPADVLITEIGVQDSTVTITWTGGLAPYQLQRRGSLTDGVWDDVGTTTTAMQATDTVSGGMMFYRVRSN